MGRLSHMIGTSDLLSSAAARHVCVARPALPKFSYQLRDPKALSGPLQAILAGTLQDGHAWTRWASSFHTWLFTCEMALPLSRERGAPVLRVSRYKETGELTEVGAWTPDRDGRWMQRFYSCAGNCPWTWSGA